MPARLFAKPNLVIELMQTLQPREEEKQQPRSQGKTATERSLDTALPPSPSPSPFHHNVQVSSLEMCTHSFQRQTLKSRLCLTWRFPNPTRCFLSA